MAELRCVGRRYDTNEPVEVTVETTPDGGRVARTLPIAPPDDGRELPRIAPGFVDIQVNGYGGQEFSSPELTADRAAEIIRGMYAHGVTRVCPTLTTQSFEVLAHGMASVRAACDESAEIERLVACIHLEGPYIAAEEGPRGAHPLAHCRPPDVQEFQRLQDAAGGRIGLVTLSPEYDNSPHFIAEMTRAGVVVAIGHTAATGDQIKAAVDAGARLSTHLGNGAHRSLRRHPNYLWDQMGEDRLVASLIVDGHHLPSEVVQSLVRAKTPARCILVSDFSGLAGLPPGRYASSGGELEILPNGKLVIAGQDQLLAGASLAIGVGIANVIAFAGVDLAAAVAMATENPARLLGFETGGFRPGDVADFVLFDWAGDASGSGLTVRATVADGRVTFGDLATHRLTATDV